MTDDHLKEMSERCRSLAERADDFTKRRLIDLALKYEARVNGRSLATQRLVTMNGKVQAAVPAAAAKP